MTHAAEPRTDQTSADEAREGEPRTCALITGASSGIGLEFARQLAARGDNLVLVARTRERLESIAAQLHELYGVEVEVLCADLSTDDGIAAVAQRLDDAQRPIDLLVNNAGFGVKTTFLDTPLESEVESINVMVKAVMVLSHTAATRMVERGSGQIINVSSVASFMASGTYAAAKSYVTVFSESLAAQLRGTGVRVMALCPGFTHTEFHERGQIPVNKNSRYGSWMWLNADRLVSDALRDAEAGKVVSVPGRQYKVITALLRHLPRQLVTQGVLSSKHRPQR